MEINFYSFFSYFFTLSGKNKLIFVLFLLFWYNSNELLAQSVQNFGNTTGAHTTGTSTTFIPNPTTGTSYVRVGAAGGSINKVTASNPLGSTQTYIRAVAPTSGSVNKVSPIVNNTAGKVVYARAKVMFGDASAGTTATSGTWSMFIGNGAMYSDANAFAGAQVFTGLRFVFGAGGAVTMNNRAGGDWNTTGLATSSLASGIYYDFEIIGNNQSAGTVNYTYNGTSQSVAINTQDLYINGVLIGNDIAKAAMVNNADIRSITLYGESSTSNVANVFIDDVTLQNTIPASIQRLTQPTPHDLSASNYSFTTWANTSAIGSYPSNMILHWGTVNTTDPALPNTATQDYVWGYNYAAQSRVTGLGANGLEFLNTSPGHVSSSSGNLGEAVVGINSTGRQNIQVSWTAARNTTNGNRYLLRGQYRIGNSGAYTDLPGAVSAIEFSSANAGPTNYGPITLPSACENQAEVQIRWVYYWIGSGSGARDGIRLDDISITSTAGCIAPTTQASAINFSSVGTNTLTLNWTNGNGAGRVILAKAGSAVDANPNNGSNPTANLAFGSGTQVGTGNFAVFNGTSSGPITLTGLNPATTYHFRVYEYCSPDRNYNVNTATNNPNSTTTQCAAPTTQASNITFSSVNTTNFTLNWTNGNGNGRVVLIKQGSAVDANPTDGSNPTANLTFGSGTQIGTGNYTVFNGTGSGPITISGLTPNTTYHVRVYEYCTPTRNYNTSTATNNPNAQTTSSIQTPVLSAGTLTNFGTQCINGTYGPNSFTITGTDLSSANVTVSSLSGYEFATVAGGPYSSSLSLTQPGGAYSQAIFVGFIPTSAIFYGGNIVVGGGGASNINIAASGTGTLGTVPLTTVVTSSITTSTAQSGGNTLSTTCGTITEKGVVWGTSANPTVPSANSTNDGTGTGAFTSSISGLSPGTTYHVRAYATNSVGLTGYGGNNTFTTLSLEPNSHAASFSVTVPTSTTLTLNFSAANTISNASGYIILQRTGAAPTGAPNDAQAYTVGNTIGDGTVAAIISSNSTTSIIISGLANSTNYHFRLIPFGYNGSNSASYNYYTAPTVPTANGTTLAAPVTIWNHPILGIDPGISNPYTTGQTNNANITVSGIGRNGVSGNAGNDRYNTNSWNIGSIDVNRYFEFTLTPNPGFLINFNSFVYTSQRSNASIDNFAFRSSVDGYSANIGSPDFDGTTISLASAEFQSITTAITFRFYAWGASAAGNTFSINNFFFTGIVSSIGSITTGAVSTSICAGATGISIPFTYTPSPNFPSGVANFTAQLSNSSGSFASPTLLQDILSDGTGSQTISATIPTAIVSGTGYRIRVVSTTPPITGSNNGSNISIQNSITSIAPIATQNLNPSVNGAALTVTEGAAVVSRQWAYSTVSGGPYTNNLGTAATQIPNFPAIGSYYIICKSTYGAPCSTTIESNEVFINVTIDLPTVVTSSFTSINENSSLCGGNVTNDGGASVTARGVVWNTSINPTLPSINSTSNGTGLGAFSSSLSGLNPQTEYFVRAYATNSAGTSYGINQSFLTQSNPPLTQALDLIGIPISPNQIDLAWDVATYPTSGATVKGYVLLRAVSPMTPSLGSVDGEAPTASVGVVVSSTIIDPSSTYNNLGLASGTTYNYLLIPYCWDGINVETYNYFTTSAPTTTATTLPSLCAKPTVQVNSPTSGSVTASSALINWTNGNGNRTLVIVKQASPSTNEPIDGVSYTASNVFGAGTSMGPNEFVCYSNTGTSFTITGLASSTTYHYSIYSFNTLDNCYLTPGVSGSFTTLFSPSIIETFEPGTKAVYTNGNDICALGNWNLNDALIGTSVDDRKVGSKSARIRLNGSLTMLFDKSNGLGTVQIQHAKYGSDANSTWRMEVSDDGGATFTAYQSPVITTSNTNISTIETFAVNIPGNSLRIRIVKLSGGANRLNIDQISLGNFTSPNTVTTGVVSGSPFCVSNVSGIAVNIPFTSVGAYNPLNVYTAQLSNATGSFAIPIEIGSLSGDMNSGTINATIPAGTLNGSGYRIRVIASSPAITGSINGTNLSVFLNPPDVGGFFASISTPTALNLGWTNPSGCFDQILIVAKAGSPVTVIPNGDGTNYTANAVYSTGGSGTNLPLDEYAVYKAAAETSVNVSGLTTGVTYYFKIFTRKGTIWSDGAILTATPIALAVGDYRTNGTGSYSIASTWQTWNGSAWVAASTYPNSAGTVPPSVNVTIRNGHIVTLDASRTNQPIKNLTVELGARIWAQDSTYNGNRYLSVYGNISCLGNIGRGTNLYDNISFNIEGNPTTISGTGSFNASRLRKNFTTNMTTELIIAMNMGLKFASGVGSSSGTVIYNNSSVNGNKFNVTINENTTVTIRTSIGSSGNFSIDGIDGEGNGERGGRLNVNGTLIIPGTLFAFTDNATEPITYQIGTSGLIKCVNICTANTSNPLVLNGSNTGGFTFRILNGGRLELTGGLASDPNTYNKPFSKRTNTISPYTFVSGFGTVNNTFDLQTGSILEYSSNSGTMPIQSQNLNYSNLIVSGAAIKTINSLLTVSKDLTINSPATLNQSGNNINVGGDWSNYGSEGFVEGSSTVTFNGSSTQKINCPIKEDFYNLTISNSIDGVELNCNVDIANNLNLGANGKLFFGNTPSTMSLTNMDAASDKFLGTGAAIFDMSAAAHSFQIGCELPSYSGTFNAGNISTTIYNRTSATTLTNGNQNVLTGLVYANLVLSGTDNKNTNDNFTVNANFTIDGTTTFLRANTINRILSLGGNLTLANDGHMAPNCYDNLALTTIGNLNQQLSGNGNPIRFFNFSSQKSDGTLSLSGIPGNSTLRIKNDLELDYSVNSIFQDNLDSIFVGDDVLIGGVNSNYSNYQFTGNLIMNGENGNIDLRLANFTGIDSCKAQINNLIVATGNNAPVFRRVEVYPLAGDKITAIKGDLVIQQNTFGSEFDLNNNKLQIGGNWINHNSSGFIEGASSLVEFNGTSFQNITCPGGENFINLKTNCTSDLQLNNPIRIENVLDLTQGKILLNSHDLTLGTTSTNAIVQNQNSNSYVVTYNASPQGNIIHHANSNASYIFPVGDMAAYTPATIVMNNGTYSSSTISGTTIAESHPNLGGSSTNYLNRYWIIEPTNISSPNYNIIYRYSDSDIIGSESLLFPYKYDSYGWMGSPSSGASFTHGTAGSVDIFNNTFGWQGLFTFSDFTGIGDGVPLPVSLTYFKAVLENEKVNLSWQTLSELNNDYFEVEKTTDGNNFTVVAKVNGAGNYNGVLNYSTTDDSPAMGKSYYRLKQVDLDGKTEYSGLREINLSKKLKENINVHLHNSQLTVQGNNINPGDLNLEIYNSAGILFEFKNIQTDGNLSEFFDLSRYSNGVYFFRLSGANSLSKKFILSRD